jgi:hypothetical protein
LLLSVFFSSAKIWRSIGSQHVESNAHFDHLHNCLSVHTTKIDIIDIGTDGWLLFWPVYSSSWYVIAADALQSEQKK